MSGLFPLSLKCNGEAGWSRYVLPCQLAPPFMNYSNPCIWTFVANFQTMCPYMPAVVLYCCFFQDTVLQDYKQPLFLCLFFMCYLCEKYYIRQLQYSTQPPVLVGTRASFIGLRNKLDLWMYSQNETHCCGIRLTRKNCGKCSRNIGVEVVNSYSGNWRVRGRNPCPSQGLIVRMQWDNG